jgi:predicted ABC-class ATPase
VPQLIAGFPPALFETPIRRTALEDFLIRQVADAIDRQAEAVPEGYSRCSLRIARPDQKILPRSALVVAADYVEARITIRLPVRDGLIHAAEAERIFFLDLPAIVNSAMLHCYCDQEALDDFVNTMEDADRIRQSLNRQGLVAFVGDGARLARRSRSDDRPSPDAAPLTVAEGLRTEMPVPNAGSVRGLGIPAGITLIVGDAYSGRTDLVAAIGSGIYNVVPGDGRERVVTVPDAVQVVAEPGRAIQRVDLQMFLPAGPGAAATEFTKAAASAAESQMASTVEALQIGAQVLVFDESSSDPGFLAADSRLAGLAAGPRAASLAERARQIADELHVSIVVGASACAAEFVAVADRVLRIAAGRVDDVTAEAKALDLRRPPAAPAAPLAPPAEAKRWITPSSLDPSLGREDAVIEALDRCHLRFGRSTIDLNGVRQIADIHQTTTIGLVLYFAKLHYLDETRTMSELLYLIDQDLSHEGLEGLSRELRGDLARPRRYEIAAALNRLDTLRVVRRESAPAAG